MAGLGRNLNHLYFGCLRRTDFRRSVFTGACTAALHHGVRSKTRYKFVRAFIVQKNHKIDSHQRLKYFSALGSRSHRPARAFFFTRASVAFNSHDQNVSQRPRLFEQANMAGMQQVENSNRADDTLSIAFPLAPLENQLTLRDNRQFPAPLSELLENRKQVILSCAPESLPGTRRALQNEYR
jgi:hypothetical protein